MVGSASLPMLLAAGFGLRGPGRREAVPESEAGRTGEAEESGKGFIWSVGWAGQWEGQGCTPEGMARVAGQQPLT